MSNGVNQTSKVTINWRNVYAALTLGTMILGLTSRSDVVELPAFLASYAGDTLWAMLVYWLVRMISPGASLVVAGLSAMTFAHAIEILQLYHAPWIDGVRRTWLGSLVLGHDFLASDLLCYTIGVGCGVGVDWVWKKCYGNRVSMDTLDTR